MELKIRERSYLNEKLKEIIKKQLSDKSKEELLDIIANLCDAAIMFNPIQLMTDVNMQRINKAQQDILANNLNYQQDTNNYGTQDRRNIQIQW